jgi:hypothetical protein
MASRLIVNAPSSASGSRVPSSESQLDFSQVQQPAAQPQVTKDAVPTPALEDIEALRHILEQYEQVIADNAIFGAVLRREVKHTALMPRQG